MSDLILPSRRSRLSLGLSALIVALIVVVVATAMVRRSVSAQEPTPEAIGIHKVQGATFSHLPTQPIFIAVIGSDARVGTPSSGGGCDAVHIIAINPQQKAGTILNFPRDSYLEGRKITDTCRQAGFGAAVDVLKRHTGIPIQFFVTTQFTHFRGLIDDLGGIDVNVPYAMNDPPSGAFLSAGPQHLVGEQALAFSRNRKHTPNGDFSRTDNQGILILAALGKFRAEAGDPVRLFEFIRQGRRHVNSSVHIVELVRLAFLAREIDPAALRNQTIPGSTGSAGAASVVFVAPGDIYDRVRDDAIY